MKKRTLKTMVIGAMIMAFALAATACGGSNGGGQTETKAQEITGTYHSQINLKDQLNQSLASQGVELKEDVTADFTMELKDDNSFEIAIDAESLSKSLVNALSKDGPDLVKGLLTAQGINESDFDAYAAKAGYENFDAMINALVEQIETSAESSLKDSTENSYNVQGSYEVAGNALKFKTSDGKTAPNDATINSDGTITVPFTSGEQKVELVFAK